MRSAYLAICSGALLAASCTSTGQGRLPVVIPTPTPVPTPTPGPFPTPAPTYTSNPVVQPIERPQIIGGGGGLPVRPVRTPVVASATPAPESAQESSEVYGRGCGRSYNCFPALTRTSYLANGRLSEAGLEDLLARCRAIAGRITADCQWQMVPESDIYAEVPPDVLEMGRGVFAACEVGMTEARCTERIYSAWRIGSLRNAWPRWTPVEMEEGVESPFYFRLYSSKTASRSPQPDLTDAVAQSGSGQGEERTDVTEGPIKFSDRMCFRLGVQKGHADIVPDRSLETVTHPKLGIELVCSEKNEGSAVLHEARWRVTPTSSDLLVLEVKPYYRFGDEDSYRPVLLASDPIEVTITPKKSLLQIMTDLLNEHLIPFLTALAAAIALGYAIIKRKGKVEE